MGTDADKYGNGVMESGSSLLPFFSLRWEVSLSTECWLYFQNISRIQSFSHCFSGYYAGPSYRFSARFLQVS